MSNEITLAKEQLRDALVDAGLDAKEFIPERVIPPIVVIASGSPFLVPESLSKEYIMNIELMCVAGTATNEQSTEKLEDLIEQTLNALPAFARLVRVDKPYSLSTGNTEYLSTSIFVEVSITI